MFVCFFYLLKIPLKSLFFPLTIHVSVHSSNSPKILPILPPALLGEITPVVKVFLFESFCASHSGA